MKINLSSFMQGRFNIFYVQDAGVENDSPLHEHFREIIFFL